MLTLPSDIQALIQTHFEFYWLAELHLPGGTQYFSEGRQITWNSHTWYPFLDPEKPHDGIKQNLKIDEKNETTINLVNVNHGISDLLKTNDFQGCECRLHLYFPAANSGAGNAIERFRGIMGKPEEETDTIISVPVTSRLHGPRTKLPSRLLSGYCGLCFADGVDCPYNPPGIGVVDPETGLPFTWCPKSKEGCLARDMFYPEQPESKGYFGGFDQWTCLSHGKLNNSGSLGIGKKSYTSEADIQDNFLGKSVPLVYGKIRVPGIVFFTADESEFQLTGAIVGEGQMQGCKEILANNKPTHDFKYPAYFWGGYPGQKVPILGGYDADPLCCTTLAFIRTKDEVGLQPNKMMDVSVKLADPANPASDAYGGRMVRVYYYEGEELHHSEAFSNDPMDIMLDLVCAPRGGLGFDYDTVNYATLNTERAYSGATILDWDGQTRERFTCNTYIADQQTAGDVLETIREEFSMWFRDYGAHIEYGYIRPDQASVFTFSEAAGTILCDDDGLPQLSIKEKPIADIPNRLCVSFLDQDNNWEKTTFHLESTQMIERVGKVVDESLFLKATTNIGQAMRLASNRMERLISGNWHAELSAPPKALVVECGDVSTLVDEKLIDGTDTFLVTSVEISAELEIQVELELYRGTFYDDVVEDEYSDHLRGSPDNPMRPPAEVESLAAVEGIVQVDGVNVSEVTATWAYPDPPDPLLRTVEIWWRDTLSPDNSWTRAATALSTETSAKYTLPILGYRMLEIRARAVSRYGIMRDLDNEEVPQTALLVDGTLDDDVPDAVTNFEVLTTAADVTIPPGFYRVKFDSGANNWHGVHTLYIECNDKLPFADGSVIPSGGEAVSGTGAIQAGGTVIACAGKHWTPHDPMLVGALALVSIPDMMFGTKLQARLVIDNTADTITVNGPWYLPDGSYEFEARTDFTKANLRGWMMVAAQGMFDPSARSFQFDLPVTNSELYFRVVAFNAFGMSPWVVTEQAISNYPLDKTPAPLPATFVVSSQGYTLEDGTQRSLGLIADLDPPDPALNYSHIIVFADVPVPGQAEKQRVIIGEFWGPGETFEMAPTALGETVEFMAVAVNEDGWFPPEWETNGQDQPGGYRLCSVAMSAEDTAPPAPASVTATYNPMSGRVDVVWPLVNITDLAGYEVSEKWAATEGGLATADWENVDIRQSTLYQAFVDQAHNGWWSQYRIRALDNLSQTGEWAESNTVQAYAGGSVQPVAAPINLGINGAFGYRDGVPFIFLSISWDNPADPAYGGCQVWINNLSTGAGELWDSVSASQSSSSAISVVACPTHLVQILLIPFNKAGVVPDWSTYLASVSFALDPAIFGYSVPAPSIIARNGIGAVHLECSIPQWAGMTKPYAGIDLYISPDSNTANAVKIGNYPVGHASGSTEKELVTVPFQSLPSGSWVLGTLYYFFGKLIDPNGVASAFSADPGNTAVFISGAQTDSGAADFSAGAEVLRIAAGDRQILAGWFAPTINATTVYASQYQVARDTAFTDLVENVTIESATGSDVVVLPANGTYYARVRYRNNSPAQWSEWFGLVEGGTAYATVLTRAEEPGDTTRIDGDASLTGYYELIPAQDAIRVWFKMAAAAANCGTWYGLTALWSDDSAKLDDANYILSGESNRRISWQNNDSWVSVYDSGGNPITPATTWLQKQLQWRTYTSPDIYHGFIITQIDTVNKRVQLNCPMTGTGSLAVARIVTPYWDRAGVYFHEFEQETQHHMVRNVNYYLPPINQLPSGSTIYFKLIPYNFFGPGTAESFNIANGSKSYNVATYGQGYATDTAPTGTLSSYGGQWFQLPNHTATRQITFSYAQATDKNEKADAFVVVVKTGGGTPDPAVDQKYIFPVQHTSGTQAYKLDVNGLNPFTTYAFRLYAAKTGASGMILSSSYQSTADTSQSSTDNLALKPKTLTGHIRTESYNSADLTVLHCSGIAEDNFNEYVELNDATQTTTVAADGTVRLAAPYLDFQAGNVICGAAKPIYFGPAATNGSWRIIRSDVYLEVQVRISGTWETAHRFEAP